MQSIIYDVDHVNHLPRVSASLAFGHIVITPVFKSDTFTHYETKIRQGLVTTTLTAQTTTEAKQLVKNHLLK